MVTKEEKALLAAAARKILKKERGYTIPPPAKGTKAADNRERIGGKGKKIIADAKTLYTHAGGVFADKLTGQGGRKGTISWQEAVALAGKANKK